jgi:hypothetical protein
MDWYYYKLKNNYMSTTTPVTVKQTSHQWALSAEDFLKSLIAAILTPLIPIVTPILAGGSLTFNWKQMGAAALLGFVGYLSVKLMTPSHTVVTGTVEGATTTLTVPSAGTKTTATQTKL